MSSETITQINRPAPFIEAAAAPYVTELTSAVGDLKTQDLAKQFGPQFVAGPSALQQQAEQLASGLGGFQPFLQTAATQAGDAATQAGLASQFVGPQAYQQFMSPFQTDVIKTTLDEFDRQTAAGIPALNAQAIQAGAFGGGRQGVQQAEFLSNQARNRAALQAQLLGQGFGQAQQAAQTAFGQQQALAQQQQNLSQQQQQLASLSPALLGQQIGALSTLGAQQQAQAQAGLSAQQQLAQAQANQQINAAQTLGSGIMGLISGYPGGTQQQMQPTPSPLQTALSAGATLAGIYRAL
jgi:hypothetical protein